MTHSIPWLGFPHVVLGRDSGDELCLAPITDGGVRGGRPGSTPRFATFRFNFELLCLSRFGHPKLAVNTNHQQIWFLDRRRAGVWAKKQRQF